MGALFPLVIIKTISPEVQGKPKGELWGNLDAIGDSNGGEASFLLVCDILG